MERILGAISQNEVAGMKAKFFRTPADFRAWLEKHHASSSELLVGFYKRESGKPSITWHESVGEALCFGWIDGVRRRVDDVSTRSDSHPASQEASGVRSTPSASDPSPQRVECDLLGCRRLKLD